MIIRMKRVDPDINMDRYYSVQLTTGLFGDYRLERRWGRNGTWGCLRLDWFQSKPEAENAMSYLVKGYIMKHATPNNFNQNSLIEI